MHGLNIHLQALEFFNDLFQKNDKVRVSITTIPEDNKQAFIIDAKKMREVHHFFTVNITDKTKKIIFVFRKKSFIHNDPIVASTIIHSDMFPKEGDDKTNTEMKIVNIYEPLHSLRDSTSHFVKEQRKVFGQMYIQFSLTEEFPDQNYNTKYQTSKSKPTKSFNQNKYAKMDTYLNDENQNIPMFIDNYQETH